jgi:hypothetical protein
MKNFIYLNIVLFAGMASASNIGFPDTNFKDKLLQSSSSNTIAKDINGISMQIDADSNNEISLEEASAVYQLDVSNASITNLTGIQSFINLRTLDFHQNLVATVDLSALVNLQSLDCHQNSMSAVDLAPLVQLQHLFVNQNNLSTIDLSTLTNLVDANISNNSLYTIYAKNGNDTDAITITGGDLSNLTYICIDEAQVADTLANLPGGSPVIINSYCSSTPGGNYATISGTIAYDENGNGIDAMDAKFPFVKVQCTIGTETLQTTSDANGHYAFYTEQSSGSYTLTPAVESSGVFVMPAAQSGILGANATVDFPITAMAPTPDLEVIIAPNSAAVAGNNTIYQLTYKNKGSKFVTGSVVLNYDSSKMSILSCSDASASVATPGLVSLNFSNLLPFETRSFYITLAINAENTLGSPLLFNASITDNLGATEPSTAADNTFNYKQYVGTVNQNTIDCLEGPMADSSQIGDYLHYRVNFENTGNAVANNVVVKMTFNPLQFDLNSLQVLNSSNPLDLKVSGTTALFYMGNVAIGGPGGDGGILLKIKTLGSLTPGSTVASNAQIFFDYGSNFIPSLISESNATSNNALTTFQTLDIAHNTTDASIVVYPNPANSVLYIDSNNTIKTIQLYDIAGRLLQTNLTDATKLSIDLTQRANGVYFLKISSDKGQKVEKIIKN